MFSVIFLSSFLLCGENTHDSGKNFQFKSPAEILHVRPKRGRQNG